MSAPFTGHEVAPPSVLTHALQSLLAPDRPDPDRLASCRTAIEAEVAGRLGQVDTLVAEGRRTEAQIMLKDIDARYGGLAAPHSIALDQTLTRIQPSRLRHTDKHLLL